MQFVKEASYCKFRLTFPLKELPHGTVIYRHIKSFQATGIILDMKKYTEKMFVLTEERVDKIGDEWGHFQENVWYNLQRVWMHHSHKM
jgi:hypothetical protein